MQKKKKKTKQIYSGEQQTFKKTNSSSFTNKEFLQNGDSSLLNKQQAWSIMTVIAFLSLTIRICFYVSNVRNPLQKKWLIKLTELRARLREVNCMPPWPRSASSSLGSPSSLISPLLPLLYCSLLSSFSGASKIEVTSTILYLYFPH